MTTENTILDKITKDNTIQTMAKNLAVEFANRNLAPLYYVAKILNNKSNDSFDTAIVELHSVISKIVSSQINGLKSITNKPQWLITALFMGNKESEACNIYIVSKYICVSLIEQHFPTLDDQINNLQNRDICDKLGIDLDEYGLVDLSGEEFTLKSNGIVCGQSLIFPHQFLRKEYSDGFDQILDLLSQAKDTKLKIKIRLDPFRITGADKYQDPSVEKDYWYGKPFNKDMLANSDKKEIFAIHHNCGLYTIFRSSMMDTGLRQFMVEDFAPKSDPVINIQPTPGFGDIYCIQKFAHFVFDQKEGYFTHFDVAIRVFCIREYETVYNKIKGGERPEPKIGIRHKLFLIEGSIDSILMKDILYEFFRYNPHLQEYFNNEL